jgi:hypothetical protein
MLAAPASEDIILKEPLERRVGGYFDQRAWLKNALRFSEFARV